jgi:O-antigen/teichoic acid export membrane protein
MSVFTNIISAHEKFIFQKIVSIISTVISPLVTLPLLLMGYRSVAIVVVSVTLSFITYFINAVYVIFRLKNKFYFSAFPKGIFKGLFRYTIFIAINTIIDQINWNIDKLLLGRFVGTAAVAVYSVGYALYGYYMSFSLSISSVFTPRIHAIVNKTKDDLHEQRVRLTDLFIRVGRIQFLVLGLVACGVVIFGQEFIINVWAGKDYEDSYYVALLLILPASIALIQNLGIEIQRALNRHAFRSYAYLVMAIVNLILSIYLCQRYGAIGSAIGTAISLILANGIIMNIYYHLKCNIDIIEFWKNIMSLSKGLILPVFVGIIIKRFSLVYNNIALAIWIVIFSVIYVVSMWNFGMNHEEKNLILEPLKRHKK